MLGKGLQLKTTAVLVFFLWLVKSEEVVKKIGLLITYRNAAFFLISSMVLVLLDQLQIFLQWYVIELLAFNMPGATRAVALGTSKAFDMV